MSEEKRKSGAAETRASKPGPAGPRPPGPARLFALLAGAFLALLGVLGFFYDAGFGTGSSLASDDLAGTLMVNGWRNVIYLATGIVALGLAPRRARATAFGLGLFYLVYAIWGFIVTDRGIGSILDFLPLGNDDNALHLVIGVLGTFAALVDGPLPKVPERLRPRRPKPKPRPRRKPEPKAARSGRGARPQGREGPRRGGASEPR